MNTYMHILKHYNNKCITQYTFYLEQLFNIGLIFVNYTLNTDKYSCAIR